MTQTRVYLDYAATAPLRSEALAAMLPFLEQPLYNASSLHQEGRRARIALEEARERVARVLGAKRKEILFVASGSEADGLGIMGMARASRRRRIVASAIEHHAVLRSLDALHAEGYVVTSLPVSSSGFVEAGSFEAALGDDVALAAIMYANNEIGTIQAIERLSAIARRHGVPFFSDAVAAAGWLPLDVTRLGVDAMALASHKFGGPKGTGVLYVRDGTPIAAVVHGGGQEFGKRAGTEDVASAVGSAVALELAERERTANAAAVERLRRKLEEGLLANIPGARVNGGEPRLPGITNLSFAGVRAEALAMRLDLEGIATSPGSACTSGVAEPSHVAAALGNGPADEALRLSLGAATTEEEIERVLQVMPIAVSEQRRTYNGLV